jgi:sulfate transport system ATP-binding protein
MYDHPANEFVMKFLGPATRLNDQWVRPHDLMVHREPSAGGHRGTVERVTHLGFEVRVDVAMAQGGQAWVQLSRGAANEIDLVAGDAVWISLTAASARPQRTPDDESTTGDRPTDDLAGTPVP